MSWLYLSKPCAFLSTLHTELAGAAGARPSLRPLFKRGSNEFAKLRRNRAVRMRTRVEGPLHLAPLAGRGRIASPEAIRVRGYRSIDEVPARREPLTPTLSPQERGEGEVAASRKSPNPARHTQKPAKPHA